MTAAPPPASVFPIFALPPQQCGRVGVEPAALRGRSRRISASGRTLSGTFYRPDWSGLRGRGFAGPGLEERAGTFAANAAGKWVPARPAVTGRRRMARRSAARRIWCFLNTKRGCKVCSEARQARTVRSVGRPKGRGHRYLHPAALLQVREMVPNRRQAR